MFWVSVLDTMKMNPTSRNSFLYWIIVDKDGGLLSDSILVGSLLVRLGSTLLEFHVI